MFVCAADHLFQCLSTDSDSLHCVVLHNTAIAAAQMYFHHSGFDVIVASCWVRHKRCFDMNIQTEMYL